MYGKGARPPRKLYETDLPFWDDGVQLERAPEGCMLGIMPFRSEVVAGEPKALGSTVGPDDIISRV